MTDEVTNNDLPGVGDREDVDELKYIPVKAEIEDENNSSDGERLEFGQQFFNVDVGNKSESDLKGRWTGRQKRKAAANAKVVIKEEVESGSDVGDDNDRDSDYVLNEDEEKKGCSKSKIGRKSKGVKGKRKGGSKGRTQRRRKQVSEMTAEEREEMKAKWREEARLKRQRQKESMSVEEREAFLKRQRERKKEERKKKREIMGPRVRGGGGGGKGDGEKRRKALTAEQKREQSQKAAMWRIKRRENMTEDERRQNRMKRYMDKMARLSQMTAEEREEQQEREREYRRQLYRRRREKKGEGGEERRKGDGEGDGEENEEKRRRMRELMKKRRENMTEEQRERQRRQLREYYYRKMERIRKDPEKMKEWRERVKEDYQRKVMRSLETGVPFRKRRRTGRGLRKRYVEGMGRWRGVKGEGVTEEERRERKQECLKLAKKRASVRRRLEIQRMVEEGLSMEEIHDRIDPPDRREQRLMRKRIEKAKLRLRRRLEGQGVEKEEIERRVKMVPETYQPTYPFRPFKLRAETLQPVQESELALLKGVDEGEEEKEGAKSFKLPQGAKTTVKCEDGGNTLPPPQPRKRGRPPKVPPVPVTTNTQMLVQQSIIIDNPPPPKPNQIIIQRQEVSQEDKQVIMSLSTLSSSSSLPHPQLFGGHPPQLTTQMNSTTSIESGGGNQFNVQNYPQSQQYHNFANIPITTTTPSSSSHHLLPQQISQQGHGQGQHCYSLQQFLDGMTGFNPTTSYPPPHPPPPVSTGYHHHHHHLQNLGGDGGPYHQHHDTFSSTSSHHDYAGSNYTHSPPPHSPGGPDDLHHEIIYNTPVIPPVPVLPSTIPPLVHPHPSNDQCVKKRGRPPKGTPPKPKLPPSSRPRHGPRGGKPKNSKVIRDVICEDCGNAYNRKYIGEHKSQFHNPNFEQGRCLICGEHFTNARVWYRHLIRVHGGDPSKPKGGDKPVMCDICGMSFVSGKNMQQHKYFTHGDGLKKENFKRCPVCPEEKLFKSSVSLYSHLKFQHPGYNRETRDCYRCSGSFPGDGELSEHVRVEHPGSYFPCEYCKSCRFSRLGLNFHVKRCPKVPKWKKEEIKGRERVREGQGGKGVDGEIWCLDEMTLPCEFCGRGLKLTSMSRHYELVHKVGEEMFRCGEEECQGGGGKGVKGVGKRAEFKRRIYWVVHMEEKHRRRWEEMKGVVGRLNVREREGLVVVNEGGERWNEGGGGKRVDVKKEEEGEGDWGRRRRRRNVVVIAEEEDEGEMGDDGLFKTFLKNVS